MSLTNKVALITGASSGIGAAIAIKFAKEGANVVIVGRNKAKLKNVSDSIRKVGLEPLIIIADIRNHSGAQRIIDDTLKLFGKLDILVNNAGLGGEVTTVTDKNFMAVFDLVMNTNVRAAVNLTHLASKYLFETKGSIINISSVAAQMLVVGHCCYCASKAALDHFARSIALEFSSSGVRVNNINPGPVKTDLLENIGLDKDKIEAKWNLFSESTSLKRVSEAAEIAEVALFLASDKSLGITGSNFVCDNGLLI